MLQKTKSFFKLLLIATLVIFCTQVNAGIPLDGSLAPMLKNVLPSVVNIKAQIKVTDFKTLREIQKDREKSKPEEPENENSPFANTFLSVGSGVIIDAENGYIITNAHLINDAQLITITLSDSHRYTAKVIGIDKPSDVALLQIKAKNLTALPISDSNQLKVGDFVAAIGNPFGLNQSVSSGIVSALGRTTLGIESYENFIQTDAPINPGNSGGALINMKGEFVGMNTAILAPARGNVGIGFAIPSDMIKSVISQLIQFGNVKRGALGIGTQAITPELANAFNLDSTSGSAVTQVLTGSPAEIAGLHVGDIIKSINGITIKNASDVVNTVAFLRMDTKITISILRNNKLLTLNAILNDPKLRQKNIEEKDPFLYGVGLKDFSVLSPAYGSIQGVIVIGVEPDSKAWQSDLRPGDIITSINQHKVTSITQLQAEAAKANKSLLLNVIRGPIGIFLVIDKET